MCNDLVLKQLSGAMKFFSSVFRKYFEFTLHLFTSACSTFKQKHIESSYDSIIRHFAP